MPLSPGQTDPLGHNSLCYEDALLLRLRIERLKEGAVQPAPAQPLPARAAGAGGGSAERGRTAVDLRTAFLYVEARGTSSRCMPATAAII